jgi:hypothetical protein
METFRHMRKSPEFRECYGCPTGPFGHDTDGGAFGHDRGSGHDSRPLCLSIRRVIGAWINVLLIRTRLHCNKTAYMAEKVFLCGT